MKFHYYPETDSLYIDLAERPGVETREVAPGVNLDFDVDGKLIGIDIDHASESVNLERLEAEALPISESVCARPEVLALSNPVAPKPRTAGSSQPTSARARLSPP